MTKLYKDSFLFIILNIWCHCLGAIYLDKENNFSSESCLKLNFKEFYEAKLSYTDIFTSKSPVSRRPNRGEVNDPGKKFWMTSEKNSLAPPGPCTIEKIPAKELDQEMFLSKYAYHKPVVIVNSTDNKEFQDLTSYKKLINNYGHTWVKLSSANSYSYDTLEISFRDYCENYLKPQSLSTYGNETFYFFGDNNNEEWYGLFDKYNHPPYFLPEHVPQLSFGVAGPGSGVPFHFHGPGFAETLWGRKRWFMYSPEFSPRFHPNQTTLQWLLKEYPSSKLDSEFLECTLSPGELIYFPDHWWHATLNVDTTVFMSTFLSP